MSDYSKFLNTERRSPSRYEGRSGFQESLSDKSRVVYSSAFRRMQQKAQVFSLETNAAVRSRLTHTLEVADVGKRIAIGVANQLFVLEKLSQDEKDVFINLAETACLMHDIGNPPFGHFGEEAIKRWFKNNYASVLKKAKIRVPDKENKEYNLLCDFFEFDGNPQGFRIVTQLSGIKIEDYDYGMNLTYAQLGAFMKYVRLPGDEILKSKYKKAGYFHTEKNIMDDVNFKLGLLARHPTLYIMEAADDISYCISDIEDGIEKRIITPNLFFNTLVKYYVRDNRDESLIKPYIKESSEYEEYDFFKFKIDTSINLSNRAIENYIENETSILNGTNNAIMEDKSNEALLLKYLKEFARTYLFTAPEAENMEIAGFNVIKGLLDDYKSILELETLQFALLLSGQVKGMDIEKRLLHKLPLKYIQIYKGQLKKYMFPDLDQNFVEWYLRAHLIVDYISGMTDTYSLQIHKLFKGIDVK
jgi:dGTPase